MKGKCYLIVWLSSVVFGVSVEACPGGWTGGYTNQPTPYSTTVNLEFFKGILWVIIIKLTFIVLTLMANAM